MRIGMHVRGFQAGRPVAVSRALERGAETIQIFASNPRAWRLTPANPEADREFVRQMAESDVQPLFIHAPYLVNLASASAEFRRRSWKALQWNLVRAESLDAKGVVVHAGSFGNRRKTQVLHGMARAIHRLLPGARGPALIFELTAGGRGAVASNFDDAAQLLDACDGNPRVRFCLDTCHLHAAGSDLSTEESVNEVVGEFRSKVGTKRLALIHSNDSRDPRGSRRDRHWHVGRGQIGLEGFRSLVQHPGLSEIPLICETPGTLADDRRNLRMLKKLRDG